MGENNDGVTKRTATKNAGNIRQHASFTKSVKNSFLKLKMLNQILNKEITLD